MPRRRRRHCPKRPSDVTQTFELAPGYSISRVIRGGWQLAGGHGAIDREQAVADLVAAFDAGITTYDCADIYTGVEELIGATRLKLASERGLAAAARMNVHTKLVPDLEALARISRQYIRGIVDTSLKRLKTERLDLVQFHWWDYSVPGYVEAALALERLRAKGKVAHIGLTNFDLPHLLEITAAGVRVTAHQLQYSLLDARAEGGMVETCLQQGIALLCYGTVAGGFLSDRWLGRAEPDATPANRSLIKYKLIIEDFGGWALFQRLLGVLKSVADRKGCDIASVASRAMLDKPGVAAVIVGATSAAHLPANAALAEITLDADDYSAINAVTSLRTGPQGDVYTLERDREGRHGRIMKYELSGR